MRYLILVIALIGLISCTSNSSDRVRKAVEAAKLTSSELSPEVFEATGRVQTIYMTYNQRGEAQLETPASLDRLIEDWNSRYAKCRALTGQFASDIEEVKKVAADYIIQQKALTERIRDPERKKLAKERDYEDFKLYETWKVSADNSLEIANNLMSTFHDIDIELSKLELRQGYAFVSDLEATTLEVQKLETELLSFREASDLLAAVTPSPFESSTDSSPVEEF